MKMCAQCHGKLGLGVRSRNVWNGRWWVHVRYCSVHCEALHELERYNARASRGRHASLRRAEPNATSPEIPLWRLVLHMRSSSREETMVEQPVNLPTAIYLGVFSRAEQRVLQAIFKAIAEGGGRCVATLAMLARDSNTSKPTTRNAIAQAVAIGLLAKTERRSYCAVRFPTS
jgi:hypothetical protein